MRAAVLTTLCLAAYVAASLKGGYPDPVPCPSCKPSGYASAELSKAVALTFDDGPNPDATRRILDALDARGAKAAFFVLGQNVLRDPDTVREIGRRGHLIGNHGFTHEWGSHSSEARLAWELNYTNGIVERLTGRSALLYRPPYLMGLRDAEVAAAPDESPAWDWAAKHGYSVVGADLDPLDWMAKSPEKAIANVATLLDAREQNAAGGRYHVFLLHDLETTAEAMPGILDLLESRGYRVVPLESLLGMSSDQAMPLAPRRVSGPAVPVASLAPWLAAMQAGIFIVTAFALFRPLSLLFVKRFVRERRAAELAGLERLRVTALVPAFNEAENIKATLESLIAGTRVPDEIIVINDGSTDDTECYAREVESRHPSLVHVVRIRNAGKANALGVGLGLSTGEIVVAIDGDTVLGPECVERLVARFADPEVGAVSGKLVPANSGTMLAKFQTVEYAVGQNVEKAAFSVFGAVGVVPGAAGAWRRDAIERAGGYSSDTIVEDQDLTLGVLAAGYKVAYEGGAVAYTEVPASYVPFFLQRFRWTFGTFQCMWKYRNHLGLVSNPRIGWLALLHGVLYNVAMPLLAMGVFVATVLTSSLSILEPTLVFFAQYAILEMAIATYALSEEAKRDKRLIGLVLVQRLAYMVAYTGILALVVLKALDGSRPQWNKLARLGCARELYEREMGSVPAGTAAYTIP